MTRLSTSNFPSTKAHNKAVRLHVAANPWRYRKLGKGFVTASGNIISWILDDDAQQWKDTDGYPFHCHVGEALRVSYDRGCFYVGPRGGVQTYNMENHADRQRVKDFIAKRKELTR
jgi:hypothetical protein